MKEIERILLFTYGTLKVGHRPPATLGAWWPDRIRGDWYDDHEYPAIINVGNSNDWVTGQAQCICRTELAALDDYEETHLGIYRRMQATTEREFRVYVYEFCR